VVCRYGCYAGLLQARNSRLVSQISSLPPLRSETARKLPVPQTVPFLFTSVIRLVLIIYIKYTKAKAVRGLHVIVDCKIPGAKR
jgi:hypothetical protein